MDELPFSRVLVTGRPEGPRTIGIRSPGGCVTWVRIRAIPSHDARGALDGAVVFLESVGHGRPAAASVRTDEEWRSLAANLPDFVMVLDHAGRIVWVNRVVSPFEADRGGGTSFEELLDPLNRLDLRSTLDAVLSTGERAQFETDTVLPDGRDASFHVTFVPLFEGPSVERVLVVARDVTASRRAEAELGRSEQRWSLLAKNVPDVLAVLDRDARITWMNRTSSVGQPTVGRSAYELVTEDSAEEYRAKFAEVLASRRTIRFETCSLTEDGSPGRWFEAILAPLVATDGEPVERVLAVARDVTDRKRADEQIRASEQRWRTLVDSLPDIVLVLDRDRRILSANVPKGELGGVPVIGTLADVFVDESMVEQFHDHVARALETEKPVRYELRSAEPDAKWYDAILAPVNGGDSVDRLLVVTRDNMSGRAMIASLAEKERLASVGMVASSVAHEVMNPLTYVLANLEAALNQPSAGTDGWRQALVDAREGAKRMQRIVWDLRSLGRAGTEELLYVDARSVLETALRLSGPEVARKATVTLDLLEVPGVCASESRLCQVFINLLVNAAQSMEDEPPEEREIHVRTRYDETTSRVAIAIADRGPGIAALHRARIFEPFFTTKRAGMGLGLSISRDIITRMGGRIDFESTMGEGTTFTVWLPTTRRRPDANGEP